MVINNNTKKKIMINILNIQRLKHDNIELKTHLFFFSTNFNIRSKPIN
jgi:hypothetical protein